MDMLSKSVDAQSNFLWNPFFLFLIPTGFEEGFFSYLCDANWTLALVFLVWIFDFTGRSLVVFYLYFFSEFSLLVHAPPPN